MGHGVNEVLVEALFLSDLQPSQAPSGDEVCRAVAKTLSRYGAEGCAAVMAAEYGDHPETAVRRMSWARRLLGADPSGVHLTAG